MPYTTTTEATTTMIDRSDILAHPDYTGTVYDVTPTTPEVTTTTPERGELVVVPQVPMSGDDAAWYARIEGLPAPTVVAGPSCPLAVIPAGAVRFTDQAGAFVGREVGGRMVYYAGGLSFREAR